MLLRARQFQFTFPRPSLVMGIVNVTPDSFSDGGLYVDPEEAVRHALRLVEEGAEIIDVGGESTRPNAAPVSEAEELRRVLPVIKELAGRVNTPVSIDTMKPGVAQAAIQAGASIVNDVAANRTDPAMWRVVAEAGAGYVCLHMQGSPQTMQINPVYGNVVAEVGEFFFDRIQRLNGCGVGTEQIILDVGIGFGKTLEHNLQLLGALESFARFGRPLMLGVSHKSFIGKLTGAGVTQRLPGALACASLAVESGVQILRAHEVAPTVQAMRVAEAIIAKKAL
jgi:dihydropteroate synthase